MGIRVLKTAIAATVAVYLAYWLQLDSYLTAGILAILGVDVTKKRGLTSSSVRILASILGLVASSLIFALLGFQIWVLAVFIMIVYPILVKAKLHDGIITSSVVVVHLFAAQTVAFANVLNEIELLLVGLGTATLINLLYMPKVERRLLETREKLEQLFAQIFKEIGLHLRNHDTHVWDGQELLRVGETLREGISLSRQSAENALFQRNEYWENYFEMRRQQLDYVQRMLDLVAQVYQTLPHGQATAEVFDELSVEVRTEYYTGQVEALHVALQAEFKQMSLPNTREEFEVRSTILQLFIELKNYLDVAKKLKKKNVENKI